MIKIAYMSGMRIVADFEEVFTGEKVTGWKAKNPTIIQYTANGPMLYPLLDMVKEDEVFLSIDKAEFPVLFEPLDQIRNLYSTEFGSGVQISMN